MKSEALRCPNCDAPLPASAGAAVRCTYCNQVSHQASPPVSRLQVAPRKSRLGLVIVGIIAATLIGVFAVVGVIVFKVNDAVQDKRHEAESKRQQVIHRADQIQREALDRVEEALDQAALATEEAMGAKSEALERINKARSRTGKSAESDVKAEAPGPDPSLPEQPNRAAVARKLQGIDVSHCRGDFAITFTVRVKPDGTTTAPTMGPLRAENADISCVRKAITKLTFPKSQRGLALRHELRGGTFE